MNELCGLIIAIHGGGESDVCALIADPSTDDEIRIEALGAFAYLAATNRVSHAAASTFLATERCRALRDASFPFAAMWAMAVTFLRIRPLHQQAAKLFSDQGIPENRVGLSCLRQDIGRLEGISDPSVLFVENGIGPLKGPIASLLATDAYLRSVFNHQHMPTVQEATWARH